MTSLLTLLQSIPDVIWSGVIASALTLGGVLISNGSNTKRLKLQLQHDSNEKAKERTATLRREVYLRAAEELVRANAHLASLPQIDVTKVNAGDGLQGFFAATARLQLVAEPATALLVNQLSALYGELVLKLMAKLAPVQKAKIDIRSSDDLYSKAQAEVTRILSEMTKQNESGQRNAFRALNSNFEFQQDQARKHASARSEAWDRFNKSNIQFSRNLFSELRAIGSQQIPVLIAIRRDLGLSGEIEVMEAQMHLQWERMEKQLDALVAALGERSGTSVTE